MIQKRAFIGDVAAAGAAAGELSSTVLATALGLSAAVGAAGGVLLSRATSPSPADTENIKNNYLTLKLKSELAKSQRALEEQTAALKAGESQKPMRWNL